jgi:hypothetical protein
VNRDLRAALQETKNANSLGAFLQVVDRMQKHLALQSQLLERAGGLEEHEYVFSWQAARVRILRPRWWGMRASGRRFHSCGAKMGTGMRSRDRASDPGGYRPCGMPLRAPSPYLTHGSNVPKPQRCPSGSKQE